VLLLPFLRIRIVKWSAFLALFHRVINLISQTQIAAKKIISKYLQQKSCVYAI
jgi:hypothetical protein